MALSLANYKSLAKINGRSLACNTKQERLVFGNWKTVALPISKEIVMSTRNTTSFGGLVEEHGATSKKFVDRSTFEDR
jgi:hypothetical protein